MEGNTFNKETFTRLQFYPCKKPARTLHYTSAASGSIAETLSYGAVRSKTKQSIPKQEWERICAGWDTIHFSEDSAAPQM